MVTFDVRINDDILLEGSPFMLHRDVSGERAEIVVGGYAGPKEGNNFYDCDSNNTGCFRAERRRTVDKVHT